MSISGIHGGLLEITVVECSKLRDTEWFSRQDPYVCLEYGNTKFRTRTCRDGGKNPVFQEKFIFTLIEGLREINVVVWNSNTLTYDDLIGSGKVQLHDVLFQSFDDKSWPLQTKTGRYAGEVKLIMHYAQHNKPAASYTPSAPPYIAPPQSQVSPYPVPPSASASPYTNPAYPSPPTAYPSQAATYPPPSSAYPPPSSVPCTSCASYPPAQLVYPPFPYPPPSDPSFYPPPTYPPLVGYPPPSYPPPPIASPYSHPGSYSVYPPPPPY